MFLSILNPPSISKFCVSVSLGARWHAGVPTESIFNMIFEFSAVFTCYLTYYKPIGKKSWFGAPMGTPAKSIFNIIFEFSAVFTCYLTYYKPIAKKDCLARPRARRGRAVCAKWDFFTSMNLFYQYI